LVAYLDKIGRKVQLPLKKESRLGLFPQPIVTNLSRFAALWGIDLFGSFAIMVAFGGLKR
jgi:hypothetical protein